MAGLTLYVESPPSSTTSTDRSRVTLWHSMNTNGIRSRANASKLHVVPTAGTQGRTCCSSAVQEKIREKDLVPETAQGMDAVPLMFHKIVQSQVVWRSFLSSLFLCWILLCYYFYLYPARLLGEAGVHNGGHMTNLLTGFTMLVNYTVVAAFYPTDAGIASLSFRHFLMPASFLRAFGDTYAIVSNILVYVDWGPANRTCAYIDAAANLVHLMPSWALAWWNWSGSSSWARIRGAHFAKSATFLAAVVLMRAFGPPKSDVYPQNIVGLAAAITRPCYGIFIFGLLTPRNRLRLGAVARASVFRVCVSLAALKDMTCQQRANMSSTAGLFRRIWSVPSDSSSQPTSCSTNDGGGSHHTAKQCHLGPNAGFALYKEV